MPAASVMGLTQELLPSARPDTNEVEQRFSKYGDAINLMMGGPRHSLAAEGSYFVTTNPTPGTAVAYGSGGTQTSFSALAGLFVIKNNAPTSVPNPINLFLDYIRLHVTGTVPASATKTAFAVTIDTGNRTPTANFTLLTPLCTNFRSARGSIGQIWVPSAGIPTVPAAVNSRLIANGCIKQAISVTLDEYMIKFGGSDGINGQAAQTVGRFCTDAPPVVLGPQEYAVIHLWQPSAATNALSVEFEIGHWER